jgi:hypothetical protein
MARTKQTKKREGAIKKPKKSLTTKAARLPNPNKLAQSYHQKLIDKRITRLCTQLVTPFLTSTPTTLFPNMSNKRKQPEQPSTDTKLDNVQVIFRSPILLLNTLILHLFLGNIWHCACFHFSFYFHYLANR